MAAFGPIFMTVSGSQLAPVLSQIAIVGLAGLRSAVLVNGLGLAPHAHVGIVLFDPLDEVVVVVRLVRPHSVLDIPVKESQRGVAFAAAAHDGNHCERGDYRHEASCLEYTGLENHFFLK